MGAHTLPVNTDSAYADDATHPSVKIHQGHHDILHAFADLFEQSETFTDGQTWVWSGGRLQAGTAGGAAGPTGVGILYRGDWAVGTTYHAVTVASQYEIVRYHGSIYVCLVTNTGSTPGESAGLPIDTTNWAVFVAAGQDGAAGEPGIDGANGDVGLTGRTGPAGPSAETLEVEANAAGTLTLDVGTATYFYITPSADVTINFEDSLALPVGQCTIEFEQTAGTWNITWDSRITWLTSDGNPPDAPAVSGDILVAVVWHRGNRWLGNAPSGGVAATPPPITYDDITAEMVLVDDHNANQTIDYSFGVTPQVGDGRLGIVDVGTFRDTTDPPVPTLSGGGVAVWTVAATTTFGTGSNRRRLTRFVGWQAVADAGSPFIVGIGGVDHVGCLLSAKQTPVVPEAIYDLALANSIASKYDDAGQSGSTAAAGLASPDSALSRTLTNVMLNSNTVTITDLVADGFVALQTWTMTAPTITSFSQVSDAAYKQNPSHALSGSVQWGMVATELGQA
jgi:hypothetical protein